MTLDDYAEPLRARFGSRPFTNANAAGALGINYSTVKSALTRLAASRVLNYDVSIRPRLWSFGSFPIQGARAYVLEKLRATFKDRRFTARSAADAVDYPFEFVRSVLWAESETGPVYYSKYSQDFTFRTPKRGRPTTERESAPTAFYKECNLKKRRRERFERLSAEFPPPCTFDALGVADFLGINESTARSLLRFYVELGELRARKEGRAVVYRFPR